MRVNAGAAPGSPPPYVAVGHVLFESVEAFQKALAPVARELQGDLVNYSDGPGTHDTDQRNPRESLKRRGQLPHSF